MGRLAVLLYGVLAYCAFLVTFLYVMAFVGNAVVPKRIDTGPEGPVGAAVLINVLLLGLFAVQHTIMARPWFKARLTRIIPQAAERSTYVLAACATLALMCWLWRPITAVVWDVDLAAARGILWSLFLLGWGMVLYSSFLIDHFDLFGLRQVVLHWKGRQYTQPVFVQRSLYRLIRHPLMAGFLIGIWATPTMTQGHLLFAMVVSGYIFVGIFFEERDASRLLGEEYEEYRRTTPKLIPRFKRRRRPAPHAKSHA